MDHKQVLREWNPEHDVPDGPRVPWYATYNAQDIERLFARLQALETRVEALERVEAGQSNRAPITPE